MVKLTKLSEPNVLKTNKVQWTQEFKDAKDRKASAAEIDKIKYRYRHEEVKEQILLETNNKCAYCESKMRHVSPGDIEHIKPKSDSDDNLFEYENLTLACTECNRRKSDNLDEDLDIINPYKTDPELHLIAVGPAIFNRTNSPIGKLAYELFELNRPALFEKRQEALVNLHVKYENYDCEKNALVRKLLKKKLEKEGSSEAEYAMVKKAYIKNMNSELRKQAAKACL